MEGSTEPLGSWQQWGHLVHISELFLKDGPATSYQPPWLLTGCPQCGCWLWLPTPSSSSNNSRKVWDKCKDTQTELPQIYYHSSYIKHLVLPTLRSAKWNESSLLFTVNHTAIDFFFPLNDTNHWHQHGWVTTDCYHGPLQNHPQLFGQLIWQPLNLDEYIKSNVLQIWISFVAVILIFLSKIISTIHQLLFLLSTASNFECFLLFLYKRNLWPSTILFFATGLMTSHYTKVRSFVRTDYYSGPALCS